MPRYLSSQGLTNLRLKIENHEKAMKKLHDDGAKHYAVSGDAWHDNPMWEQNNQQRRAMQGIISGLRELERDHTLLDDLPFSGMVIPGSIVTIRWKGEEETEEYTILGEGESDPDNMVISFETDLAKTFLDHKAGDVVSFRDQTITIIKVVKWICPTS